MSSQFDPLARAYEESFDLPWRRHLEAHTVLELLGDLPGRSVLDIGCGTGHYCRSIKRAGAARVVGYDISEGMLTHARAREETEGLGVEYTSAPPPRGAFDLALGVYVLPYAEDYPSLVRLCSIAADALRDGGRFVTLPLNPDYSHDADYYGRYGIRVYDDEVRADGSKITLQLAFGPHDQVITARHWTGATLERALTEAGFTDIEWPGYGVSPEGVREHGEEFWSAYLSLPHASVITCRKGAAG
ncbi:methyltransferase domain-containing protein [Saccharothrix sp. BKS2]|uniref:class I SAM-dependent methyltransferase n=1 Tax=Saccharothrix sp. BKS2 TaxID=3064400 RepID=UPI0039EADC72